MKTYNFVYLTTNIINGKQYIGDHSANNLNDKYLGGGTYILNTIKKYKKENFKKEILEFFLTKQEAFNAQEKYINEYNTLVPNGYNISPTGGMQCINSASKETREKMSESHKDKKHSEDRKKKMSESHKDKKHSEETKKKIGETNKLSLKGKKHSEETKKKMSESHKGKIVSKETKKKMSEWQKGKIVSEETKKKIGEANKGRIPWNKK